MRKFAKSPEIPRQPQDQERGIIKLYLDESGNTGSDWSNPTQRIFVHGGILVPSELLEVELTNTATKLRASMAAGAKELKWRSFSRRTTLFLESMEELFEAGVVPIVWAMDKQYITAAKIVETFLDPEYLEQAPMALTGASHYKRKLAASVVKQPDLVGDFAEWWSKGIDVQAEDLRQFSRQLASLFIEAGYGRAAKYVAHPTDDGLRQMALEISAASTARSTTAHSIWSILQLADRITSEMGSGRVIVIHDESREFANEIQRPSMLFGAVVDPVISTDGRTLFSGLQNISALKFANSKDSSGLQLADLICGAWREILTSKISGSSPRQGLKDTLTILRRYGILDGNLDLEYDC